MASGEEWDSRMMLDLYIHDYMLKKNMHDAAEVFAKEAHIPRNPVVVNAPGGFLNEWWSIFWDVYNSRPNRTEDRAESSVRASMENEMPNFPRDQAMNQQGAGQFPVNPGFDNSQAESEARMLAALMNDNRTMAPPRAVNSNLQIRDGPFSGYPSYLQPYLSQDFQQWLARNDGHGVLSGGSIPIDSILHGVPSAIYPRTGLPDAGKGKVVNPMPQDARPLIGAGPISSGSAHEVINISQATPRTTGKLTLPRSGFSGQDGMSGRAVEADKPSDENVEAFLSSDENTADVMSNSFSILQQRSRSSTGNKNEHGGFCFKELCSFRASNTKVLCCHFSSEGKFLASAGHEKKAMILRGDDFEVVTSGEGHTSIITDLRFKPKSSIFATSSFDRTVQIWDATRPIRSLLTLKGHAEQVTSLDFHPRKVNLMCSCDRNDQIFLWNVDESACTRISKGASRQVRFQPQAGNFLAAASGNAISLIDVETNSQLQLKGHVKDVRSICWDTTGKYIAAVSEDSAQIWSTVSGGNCIHEFHSNGNKFESCTFHPGYSQMLVIGCYKALELWSPTDGNKTMTVDAHDGIISALADSPSTETIASASHDNFVKLWK